MSIRRQLWLPAFLLLTLTAPLHGADSGKASSSAPSAERPSFEEIFSTEAPAWRASKINWNADGSAVVYQLEDKEGDALWIQQAPSWEPKILLRMEEDGEVEKLSVVKWSPLGGELLLGHDGDLSRLNVASGTLQSLITTEEKESDPEYSPDGSSIAFVRDGDLILQPLAEGEERRLTTDGDGEDILNGKTDWVYWEELWGRSSKGFWWSPDSMHLAYYRFEEAAVSTYPILDYEPVYPEVEKQRYPKAGTTNPTVRVGILGKSSGKTTWLETGDPAEFYLPRVHWVSDEIVAVERLNRDQNRLDLLRCKVSSGACEPILTDRSDTWVNVGKETRFLADGSFLWASEWSGWRHLYHYDKDGKLLRQLTRGSRDLTSVDAVNEEAGYVIVTRYGPGFLGAKDREVIQVSLDHGATKPWTEGGGWHAATVSDGGNWVHRWSDTATPDRWRIRSASGQDLASLPIDPEGQDSQAQNLPPWRFFTIPGPGGVNLPAAMVSPANLDTGRSYPAIVYHYGGPQSQVVTNRWGSRNRQLWHQWMATRGYAVIMVDNRGSDFFGKGGADRLHRHFGPTNLEAQLAGVDFLRSLEWVDTERLGLWGWSGGGSNTLYCLLNAPGVWKAGVSGAPVTDWRFYDSIWTERYLDHPESNEEGYRLSSAVTHADQLKDHLFIVHGTSDDNVHPHNTFAFVRELIDEDIPFESAIYPGQKHGFKRGPYRHFLRQMTEFFDRHLEPKAEGSERGTAEMDSSGMGQPGS